MKILILHQLPCRKADCTAANDHHRHAVTYIGHHGRPADLPAGLAGCRLVIPADEDFITGVPARTRREDECADALPLGRELAA
ncbi:hypothetical protein [Streptomyces sp. NPDC058308]|uniref:hypothetical protein n=1 Tax=Streptomyces sp. NPDC058308 TaxID=3346440 RepID=UPI0036F0C68A